MPPATVSSARKVAFELLIKLRQQPRTHSDALLRSGRVEALAPVDRNLCTTLVMGVLRWQLALDEHIRGALTRSGIELSLEAVTTLQLGAFQLLYLDRIPAHAAIFESVELIKLAGQPHLAGLVNAVLRKLSRQAKPAPSSHKLTSPAAVAAAYAHPEWLVAGWAKNYGLEDAAAICSFDQSPPPATVRLVGAVAESIMESQGIVLAPAQLVGAARRVVTGDITSTAAFRQGLVRIQDEGSQLVAELAGRGNAILDCCAAPGGKTAILAKRNPDSAITACDISPARVRSMSALLASANQNRPWPIQFAIMDATELPWRTAFDLVLCDAPCSGTGTLARNPEIRHRLLPEGLARQQERQMAILRSAMQAVAPGGRVVYATCSLEPEENQQVIDACLENVPGFRLLPWGEQLAELENSGVLRPGTREQVLRHSPDGLFVQTIPGVQACDGFFAAQLVRER